MKEIIKSNQWLKILLRILITIIIVVLSLFIIIFLMLKFYPPLGSKPDSQSKDNYSHRAINYKNGKFKNTNDFTMIYEKAEPNLYLSKKEQKPKEIIKAIAPSLIENPEEQDLTITWLGHSAILIQMSGKNILIDPVFSDYTSPIKFIGPKRFSEYPLKIEELPNIDIVLITHDHYDHLDYKTIKKLKDKVKMFIVPLEIENHLIRWDVDETKIHNMAWWEEYEIDSLTIGCTPAKHYSGRSLNDRFETLWSSWVLKNDNYQIFESGDTGYDLHFEEIYNRYGEFDLALLDSGQYNNKWKEVHMNPDEAVQASIDLHASVSMPIHWGSYSLSLHPWDDPVETFTTEAKEKNITVITPRIGETVNYKNYNLYIENNWWKDIN